MIKIKKLIASNVHGYIHINLSFNKDITFLTGSNGCGKTTALKLISSILQPNFDLLNFISFKRVELMCDVNKSKFKIILNKDAEEALMTWEILEIVSKDKRNRKTGEFELYPNRNNYDYSIEEKENFDKNIITAFLSSEFYDIIDSLGNPVLLGIDRKIFGKVYDFKSRKLIRHNSPFYRENFHQRSESFLFAQRAVIDYVSSNAEKKKELIEKLKVDFFRALFKNIVNEEIIGDPTYLDDISIRAKRIATISAVKNLEFGDQILGEVEDYFNNIKALQKKLIDSDNNDTEINQSTLREWWLTDLI